MAPREPGRHRPHRRQVPLRRTIAVVSGAEKTETAYFKGMRDRLLAASVSVKIVERAEAPDQVVQYARDFADHFDEVWCVVDVDDSERDGGKITAAAGLAARHGIELAVSNPCFELWLLLHHVECMSHCANCRVVEGLLKRQVPAYEKTKLNFRDFDGNVPLAIERARKLEPSGTDHLVNPSTGVWRLVATILEQS